MPVCRIGSCKIAVIKDKIVETLIRAWVNNAKKVLTEALPSRIGDADNNINNFNVMLVG